MGGGHNMSCKYLKVFRVEQVLIAIFSEAERGFMFDMRA